MATRKEIVNKAIKHFSKYVNGRNVHMFHNKKCTLLGLIELQEMTKKDYNSIINRQIIEFFKWIDKEKMLIKGGLQNV